MPENFSCQIIFRGGAATLNVLFIMSSHDMTITVITTCFFSFPVSLKMPKTRSSPLVWLVGPVSSTLSSTKLPSGLEVLSVFFHHHTEEKQTRSRPLGTVPGPHWMNYWRFGVKPVSPREPEITLWNKSPNIPWNGRAC